MSNNEKQMAGGVANPSFSFGGKGWAMMIFCMVVYYTCCFLGNDAMNVYAPVLIAEGWETGLVYSMNTLAGWVAVPFAFIFSWIMYKSSKLCIIISLICGAIACFWFGSMKSFAELFVVMLLFQVVFNGAVFMGTSNLLANWFPTRKGTAVGWVTIGASLNTAGNPGLWTALIAALGAGMVGLGGTFRIWGIVLIVLIVVCALFIKNNPEEAGAWPDNDKSISLEEAKRNRELGYLYKKSSPWTVGKLFKCPQMWIICIASGFIMMITVGIISNFVPIVMSYGYGSNQAILVLAAASIIGAIFSVAWGRMDALKGTKWACVSFYVIMCIALALMMVPNKVTMFIGCIFVGCSLGAGNNLMVSLTGTVFGRYDFDKAWGVIYPIHIIIRSAGFALVGLVSARTGGYRVSFLLMIICSVVAILVVSRLKDQLIGRVTVSEEELEQARAEMKK